MKKHAFKYNRSDFKPLPVKLEHMDLCLNFLNGKVEGTNTLRITARAPLDSVRLDARALEIRSVEWVDDRVRPLRYDYQTKKNILVVKLPRRMKSGTTFSIRTRTTCAPSDNILEGVYKDTTPDGCPQQYISQCQQWGFQRVFPVFDDCTAKCTMVTTLEADARYTHLISNGNVNRKTNPDGKPVLKPGDPSRKVITYENSIPMAPYLFLVAVGTWDMLEDEVIYPSGRRVKLEYLVPPGRLKGAEIPMQILKESVLWQGRTQEYEYERDVYRTICMEKSNFGGMENVGNTTIVTDAAMVDEYTGDGRLKYAYGVIVHEFEHNQCGSDVTMETPFDMWLNEAFTVDVERQFIREQFDPDCARLDQLDSMRASIGGPLAVEDAGHMGNIVRKGFNDPDELVDGLTYVKAAEVIRMLKLVLGADVFRRGKNLYFNRYKGGNANTDQFFACFEEVSGRNLTRFKKEWLFTIGYPKVAASHRYDRETRTLHVFLRQTRTGPARQPMGIGGRLFHLPLEMAAVDFEGHDIPGASTTAQMSGLEKDPYHSGRSSLAHLTFKNIPEPAFVSLNRDCSFYGTFTDLSATPEQLRRQIRLDPNRFNRVEAMRRLTDMERIKLIHNIDAEVGNEWQETFVHVLRDPAFAPGLKSYLLHIDEQSLDRRYLPFYRERYAARIKLLRTVAVRYLHDLLKVYQATDTYRPAKEPKDGYEERKLKAVLLRILVEADTPEVHRLAEDHFHRAWNITDKMSALSCISLSEHPRRREILNEAYEMWRDHLSAYAGYLGIVGGGVHDDVFDMIAMEEKKPTFHIQHPTHNRPLFLSMASNNKMLWTDRGIEWATKTVIRLAAINENSANHLVAAFQQVNQLADDLRPKVLSALKTMSAAVDPEKHPSTAGRIRAYLGT
jgi:aminopeptidase N